MRAAEDFFALRRCMRQPIDDIFIASELLDRAADAHLSADCPTAEMLIQKADMPGVRAWTESLWGSARANPDQWEYRRFRQTPAAPPMLPREKRIPKGMPSKAERARIIDRFGRNCVFCGIPLVSLEVRNALRLAYPNALRWGTTNLGQHSAFQCMWLQFDHIIPHCRGGDNTLENIVVTCAPCNFGRMEYTLEQLGLIDPRTLPITKTSWDGLERVLETLGTKP